MFCSFSSDDPVVAINPLTHIPINEDGPGVPLQSIRLKYMHLLMINFQPH